MRFRSVYMGLGGLLIMLLWLLTDPDSGLIQSIPFGATMVASMIPLLKTVLFVGLLHLSRKALVDYVDLQQFFDKALTTSEGSGLALVAVGLFTIAIAIVMLVAGFN